MSSGELESNKLPGATLRQTRESAGITQREVADALNLPMATVAAIEADDKEHLPAHVFTRGYVRAYAKLLEIDPDPLVAALSHDADETEPAEQGNVQPTAPGTGPAVDLSMSMDWQRLLTNKNLAIAVVAVLVLVVLIYLLTGLGGADDAEADSMQAPTTSLTPVEGPKAQELGEMRNAVSGNTAAGESAGNESPEEFTADTETSGAGNDAAKEDRAARLVDAREAAAERVERTTTSVSGTAPAEEVTGSPDSVAQTYNDAPAGAGANASHTDGVRRLTDFGEDTLRMQFTEECWVEIKTTDGQVLFGDLGRAGQTRNFVGSGPFKVLLGYAPGVLLEYNQEPVALSPHTRNNVANLVLGQ